ncbi:hypothetical protein L484_001426 [Morus notabilis]|uniref:Uncharacterized protein n=1 Tax=Morus notabilis TaxID=981085 RepID=W9S243_9ROSA|nr:hypothetical protein L484_001426 [Morus notabilis]
MEKPNFICFKRQEHFRTIFIVQTSGSKSSQPIISLYIETTMEWRFFLESAPIQSRGDLQCVGVRAVKGRGVGGRTGISAATLRSSTRRGRRGRPWRSWEAPIVSGGRVGWVNLLRIGWSLPSFALYRR